MAPSGENKESVQHLLKDYKIYNLSIWDRKKAQTYLLSV